jgi:hypothetical protein
VTSAYFLCFLVGSLIVGLFVAIYLARCFFVVIDATAAGGDRVEWPDEPFIDWTVHSASLVGLAAVVVVPAGILGELLAGTGHSGQREFLTLALIGPALWLFFPVGVLSLLSATSGWVFLRPVIVWRMLRLFPSTVLFYLISGVVGMVALGPWIYAVFSQQLPLLVFAAPLAAAMALIYARLLGRLAYQIVQLGPIAEANADAPNKDRSPAAVPPPHRVVEVNDPWAVPEVKRPEIKQPDATPQPHTSATGMFEEENLVSFELAKDDAPLPAPAVQDENARPKRPLDAEEEDALQGFAVDGDALEEAEIEPDLPRPKRARRASGRYSTGKRTKPGPFFTSVLGFPFYTTTLGAWIWLSVGIGMLGVFLAMMLGFMPDRD